MLHRCSTARRCVRRCPARPGHCNNPMLLFLMPLRSPAAMFRRGWTKAAPSARTPCRRGCRGRARRACRRPAGRRATHYHHRTKSPPAATPNAALTARPYPQSPHHSTNLLPIKDNPNCVIEYLSSLHGIGGQLRVMPIQDCGKTKITGGYIRSSLANYI